MIQRLEVSSWKLRSVGRKTEKIGIAVNCFAPMFVASQFQSYLFTAPAIGIRIEKKSIAGRLSF